ncbi:MAG: DNA-binding response OmpR family regulator [Psychromonas sp.]|jgi:DNA-binding response OmpR family regulator|uniref:winged helix-turn-helix domain-containing protein n=1 Tax=Psychromonas sp. TaxID=1884585 RepID=UPI0039E3E986
MANFQLTNRILIISNDSFIVGLLNGYCVAKHFTFTCISRSDPLHANAVSSRFNVIIIDLRGLTTALIEDHLEPLKNINNQCDIPVCAIHDHSVKLSSLMLPWVDYFKADTFIENLDNYINKYISNCTPVCYEQRNHVRRSGSDRRTLLGTNNLFSAPQLNDEKTLLNREIDSELLGDFEIDRDSQLVYLKGKNLELTCKEFKLFTFLAEHPERVCRTEKIITHLWPKGRANKSDLYQYMYLLRRKVELDPDNPRWILTIKGVGYKLYTEKES